MVSTSVKDGSAVSWQNEPWLVRGRTVGVGGVTILHLEALTRDAFSAVSESEVTLDSTVDIPALIAKREKLMSPLRADAQLRLMRKTLRRAEERGDTERAEFLREQIAEQEGRRE